MEAHRARRVSEAVKEELAEIIGFELDDPRLASVNVTNAEISPDGRHAHVKVAIGEGNEKKALAALEHAKSYLRHELATRTDPAPGPGPPLLRRHPPRSRKPHRLPSSAEPNA